MNQLASHPFLSTGLGFLSIILQFLSLVFGFVFLGFHKNDFGGNWKFCFQKIWDKRSQGCRFMKISYVFFFLINMGFLQVNNTKIKLKFPTQSNSIELMKTFLIGPNVWAEEVRIIIILEKYLKIFENLWREQVIIFEGQI